MKKIAGVGLLSFLLLSTGCIADTKSSSKINEMKDDPYALMELFGAVYQEIKKDYVEEPTDKKLIESAINGMLSSLDPHSGFMTLEDYEDMETQTRGEFGGLGMEVTTENSLVRVVSPIDDTPAFEAGIQAGDYVTHIDGEAVVGMTLQEAVKKNAWNARN